jgi:hypothetical protein
MNHRFASAALVAVGILLGLAAGSYQHTNLGLPSARAANVDEDPQDREVVAQLKQVNTQLKEINTLLQSGKLRVIDVINVDAP